MAPAESTGLQDTDESSGLFKLTASTLIKSAHLEQKV